MLQTAIDTASLWFRLIWSLTRAAIARPRSCIERWESPSLLLLAPGLPPDAGSGAHRPTSQLKFAGKFGVKIQGLSDAPNRVVTEAGKYLASTIPSEVEIFRIERPKLRASWRLRPKVDGGVENVLNLIRSGMQVSRDSPPEIVMSSGPPFSFAIAAFVLSRRLKAMFVMEYRDEWTECPFDFVESGFLDKLLERFLVTRADFVIYTTNSHLRHQQQTFRGHTKSVAVIPNGWEADDFKEHPSDDESQATKGRIVLSFIGKMAAHSFPTRFLGAIERILDRNEGLKSRLLIRFVGAMPSEAERLLARFRYPDNLESIDIVPKPKAISLMRASDLLLVFSQSELASYRPGKIYDYLAAHRPILVFGSPGETSSLVEKLGFGWHIEHDDVDGLERLLCDLQDMPPVSIKRIADLDQWLMRHTREHLAGVLFQQLKNRFSCAGAERTNGGK